VRLGHGRLKSALLLVALSGRFGESESSSDRIVMVVNIDDRNTASARMFPVMDKKDGLVADLVLIEESEGVGDDNIRLLDIGIIGGRNGAMLKERDLIRIDEESQTSSKLW